MKGKGLLLRELLAIGALLVIIALGINFWNNRTVVLSAPFSNTLPHTLPDDSKMVLNEGSNIKYGKGTWGEERTILLLGEAFFTVQDGSIFQVITGNGRIESLKAQFTVRSWGNTLYVECYEGRIKVRNQQQEAILTPNQSLQIINGNMEEVQLISHPKPLWTD